MAPSHFSRRQLIVDPRFQLGLMLTTGVFALFILAVMILGLFLPVATQLQPSRPQDALTIADNAAVMVYLHGRFWWIAAAAVAVGMVGALYVSHRIAGPLVRFKRHLRMLGQGTLPPPLRTRPNDYLKQEVAVLNEAVAGLARIFGDVHSAQASLGAALGSCRDHLDAVTDVDARAAIAAALAAAGRLEAALACTRRAGAPADAPASRPVPEALVQGRSGP